MALPAFADLRRHFAVGAPRGRGAPGGGADVHDGRRRRRGDHAARRRRLARADRLVARTSRALAARIVRHRGPVSEFVRDRAGSRRRPASPSAGAMRPTGAARLLTRAIAEAARRAASARVLPGADDGAGDRRPVRRSRGSRPDADAARQLLRDIGLDLDEPFVVFAPGAAYGRAKQWLPERFAELARSDHQRARLERGAGRRRTPIDRACEEIARAAAEDAARASTG